MIKTNINLKNNLIRIFLITVFVFTLLGFFACTNGKKDQDSKNYEITYDKSYQITKTGLQVELPKISYQKDDGTIVFADILVKNANGEVINSQENLFTPNIDGRYTIEYSSKSSNTFIYYVYAFSNGQEYDVALLEENKLKALEWNKEVSLFELKSTSKITGIEKIADIIIIDNDGNKINVVSNKFTPTKLGVYNITYKIGDASYSYSVNCTWTDEIQITLDSFDEPIYGESFSIPNYTLNCPDSFEIETSITLFREDDESSIIDLTDSKFTVDSSRFYTLEITASYEKDNETKSLTKDFIINRKYNKEIDTISAEIKGNILNWESRVGLTYDGYYNVIGYSLSLDNGENFIDLPVAQNSYIIENNLFNSIIVKEKRDGNGSVAESNKLFFDGRLYNNTVASFDAHYIDLVDYGSITNYWYNNTKDLTKNILNDFDSREGVLSLTTSKNSGAKINFGKTINISQDGIFCFKIYFTQLSYDSKVTLTTYGEKTANFLLNLNDYGVKNGFWSNVFVPVKDLTDIENQYINGLEIYIEKGGTVYIDEILYYENQEEIKDLIINPTNIDTTLISFENTVSSYYVSEGSYDIFDYNNKNLMQYNTVIEDGQGYLEIKVNENKTYCGININFPNKIEVNERLKISFNVFSKKAWFRIGKYLSETYGEDFNDYINIDEFTTLTFCPSVLGYENGDILEGISLCCFIDIDNPVKIGKVTYYYEKDLSNSEYISEGELANFNYFEYLNNISNINGVVKAEIHEEEFFGVVGTLKLSSEDGAIVKIQFPKSHIISANEFLNIKMYSTNSCMVLNKGNKDNISSNVYSILPFAKWRYTSISFEELGYATGDVIEDIYFYIVKGGARKFIIVDDITFGDKLDNSKLVDFDDASVCEDLIARPSPNYNSDEPGYSDQNTYYASTSGQKIGGVSPQFDTLFEEGNLVVSYNFWGTIRIKFTKSVKVTNNTKILIKINTTNTSINISKYLSNILGVDVSNRINKNEDCIIDIYAVTLGYQVGDRVDGIDLYLGKSTSGITKIDYIDYVEAENSVSYIQDNLEDNQVDNFINSDYIDYITQVGLVENDNTKGELFSYSYYKANQNIEFIDEYENANGILHVTCGTSASVGIKFVNPLTVVEKKQLKFTVKVYIPSANFAPFGDFKVSYLGYNGILLDLKDEVSTDKWTTVSFFAEDLGLTEVGTVIEGLDFYLGSYINVYFDDISYEYTEFKDSIWLDEDTGEVGKDDIFNNK